MKDPVEARADDSEDLYDVAEWEPRTALDNLAVTLHAGAIRVVRWSLYVHAADLRGYVRFDGWGAYVEDGRVLDDEVVELTLGPTVEDRVRFAADREHL